jgi:hypothetical protein
MPRLGISSEYLDVLKEGSQSEFLDLVIIGVGTITSARGVEHEIQHRRDDLLYSYKDRENHLYFF